MVWQKLWLLTDCQVTPAASLQANSSQDVDMQGIQLHNRPPLLLQPQQDHDHGQIVSTASNGATPSQQSVIACNDTRKACSIPNTMRDEQPTSTLE
jgi:hypothetical protein